MADPRKPWPELRSRAGRRQNTGSAALKISSVSLVGADPSAFSDSSNCPSSLAAGASCAVSIEFIPNAVGALSATLSIVDTAAGSPQAVALGGRGVGALPAATLSLKQLAFQPVAGGSKVTPAQAFTITNTGAAPLVVSAIGMTGSGATAFTQLNNCVGSVAVGAECWVLVQFDPATSGNFTATLTVTDNAAGSPQTVALSGTGGAVPSVSLSAASLNFGTIAAGTASTGMAVVLSNTGATTSFLNGFTLSGSAPQSFQFLQNCGSALAPGASCAIMVVFAPASPGTSTAVLTATAANPAASYSVALSGTGR